MKNLPLLITNEEQIVSEVFTITNNTGDTAHLSVEGKSCGCLSAKLSTDDVAVGASAEVFLELRAKPTVRELTEVWASVAAEGAEKRWICKIRLPLVARVSAPAQIVLPMEEGPKTFAIRVHAQDARELDQLPLTVSTSADDLSAAISSVETTLQEIEGHRFHRRIYTVLVETSRPTKPADEIRWKAGKQTGVVTIYTPSAPVPSISPRRLLIDDEDSRDMVVTLSLPSPRHSASLLRCPPSLNPGPLVAESSPRSPSQSFTVAGSTASRVIDEIVYQIFVDGRPDSTLKCYVLTKSGASPLH